MRGEILEQRERRKETVSLQRRVANDNLIRIQEWQYKRKTLNKEE